MKEQPEKSTEAPEVKVPESTADISEFPSVTPHIHSLTYRYTVYLDGDVAVEVTSGARSVKEFHALLFPKDGAGNLIERSADGRYAFFPEAAILAERVSAVVAGWLGDADDEDDDGDEDEEEEPVLPSKPKKGRRPF